MCISKKGRFERFTADNEPYLTYAGEHLQVANVIVQIVPYCYTDGDGHLQLIMHGEGQALIFGRVRLSKGYGERSQMVLRNLWIPMVNHSTIEGPTWISVVPRACE